MTKPMQAIAFCILLLACVSCSDDDSNPIISPPDVPGSGIPATETRTVSTFHSVDFKAVGDVEITSGGTQSVKVTVDDNLMEYLQTTVSNGELTIRFDSSIDPEDFELTVELTMTDLETLTIGGAGSIIGQNEFQADVVDLNVQGVGGIDLNLQAEHLRSDVSGIGSISLDGAVRRHTCQHSAIGMMATYGLEVDTAVFTLSGTGGAQVFVNDYLDVTVSGLGSLFYKGHPTVDQSVTGLGQVVDDNYRIRDVRSTRTPLTVGEMQTELMGGKPRW